MGGSGMINIESILHRIIKNPTNDEDYNLLLKFLNKLYCDKLIYMGIPSISAYMISVIEDKLKSYETNYLLSIPGMKESIQEGRAESSEECIDKLEWE